jgi:eukaryotic-like serine/threonine-protein kinase
MDSMMSVAGRYRLLDRLGVGGMSVVWRARDEVLDRLVAVKVLAPDQPVDAAARARIQAEARAAAALSHPNVAAVHDYGEWSSPMGEPVPYVVMELVDGPSLTDMLAGGPIDPVEAMRTCRDVAAGLAAAHARGLVHRDVKPGNVIVTADGAKLVDFGISAAVGDRDEADEDGLMLGTPAYLAPERLGDGVVVPGSDVYALGLLLYRMLAGAPPWSTQTTLQMLKAHAYLPPRPLPPIHGVPDVVADLCLRCLAKDPDDRPSAADVATVLTDATRTTHPPAVAAPPVGAGKTTAGTSDGRRIRRSVLVAVLVGVLVAGVFVFSSGLFRWQSPHGGSADRQPGVGQTPDLDGPSLPASQPPSSNAVAGPTGGSGGSPAGTGAGAGIGGADDSPGGVAGGPTPTGEPTPPRGPGDTPPDGPVRRSVDTSGGSAVVECTGTLARLVSWTPADGYETQAVQAGPAPSVQVRFRAGANQVGVQARCANGVPDITTR